MPNVFTTKRLPPLERLSFLKQRSIIRGCYFRKFACPEFAEKCQDNGEWLLEFKYFRTRENKESYFRDDMIVKDAMWKIYGRLVTFQSDSLSKFSFVVNSSQAFDTLCSYIPRLLNVKVSVILIDLEARSIIAEKQLLA